MTTANNKLISLREAAALVPDGANMSFSGFAETNNPLSFVREMIRTGKTHLEISGMGDAQSVELLCGAGAVDLYGEKRALSQLLPLRRAGNDSDGGLQPFRHHKPLFCRSHGHSLHACQGHDWLRSL